jgi:acetyl-CoA C-acetyltransferase
MGNCAEETASEYGITREMQDAHAIESYTRAAEAWKKGWFKSEIVPVILKDRKGEKVISVDEEYTNVKFDKIPALASVFMKNGTVTAANASTLNDGASALVLMSREEAESKGLTPLAKIVSYADAATAPKKFTIAPSIAIPAALKKAGLGVSDVSLFEINEAFSVVVRANEKILGLDPSKVNIAGGGVSLGHPIGYVIDHSAACNFNFDSDLLLFLFFYRSSGSRILVSLVHLLKKVRTTCFLLLFICINSKSNTNYFSYTFNRAKSVSLVSATVVVPPPLWWSSACKTLISFIFVVVTVKHFIIDHIPQPHIPTKSYSHFGQTILNK